MVRENHTSPPAGIFTFLGGLLLLAIFAFGVLYWVRSSPGTDDITRRRNTLRREARVKLDEQYQAQLTTEGWVDKKKGIAHVPIEEAMKLTIADNKGKKVAASTVKLDPPLPPIVIDPKSTEPPPVALPSAPQGAVNLRFDTPEATGKVAAPGAVPAAAPAAPAGVTPTRASEPPPEPRPPLPTPVAPAPAPAPVPAAAAPPSVSAAPAPEAASAPPVTLPPAAPAPAPVPPPAPAPATPERPANPN